MGLSLLVIVLHYNGLADTLECVASLGRQTYRNVHTIVIDNGSAELANPRLAADYPWVEVIELGDNLGWSGGNNTGIRLAIERNYDVVCLLNNDTVLPAHAAAKLMESAAVLGPCILHPAIDSYGRDDEPQLDPTIPQPPELEVAPVAGRTDLFEISSVNGACLLAHCSVFKRIGLIDERFFLLCEDGELGARAVSAGYRLFCDVSVRIQHKESRSFGGKRTPIKTYYGIRNMLLCLETPRGFWRALPSSGRQLVWMVWSTAEAAGDRPRSWWRLLRWSISANIFAHAVRMGVRDYLFRRFGRLNSRDEAILVTKASPP